jgi:hypothetical protein
VELKSAHGAIRYPAPKRYYHASTRRAALEAVDRPISICYQK